MSRLVSSFVLRLIALFVFSLFAQNEALTQDTCKVSQNGAYTLKKETCKEFDIVKCMKGENFTMPNSPKNRLFRTELYTTFLICGYQRIIEDGPNLLNEEIQPKNKLLIVYNRIFNFLNHIDDEQFDHLYSPYKCYELNWQLSTSCQRWNNTKHADCDMESCFDGVLNMCKTPTNFGVVDELIEIIRNELPGCSGGSQATNYSLVTFVLVIAFTILSNLIM